ncbi:MAG: hypothetical protein ACYDDF_01690 [Thermoplasmatota archaeon]
MVFFGNNLCVECQRCGAFSSTTSGHKFCTHTTCPIANRESKRRLRKRTSTLEQVYMPRLRDKQPFPERQPLAEPVGAPELKSEV